MDVETSRRPGPISSLLPIRRGALANDSTSLSLRFLIWKMGVKLSSFWGEIESKVYKALRTSHTVRAQGMFVSVSLSACWIRQEGWSRDAAHI